VEVEFLQCIHRVLKSSGVLIINLVCRNQDVRCTVISNVKTTFDSVFSVKVSEDVNETLYCLPSARTNLMVALPTEGAQKLICSSSLRNLQDMMQTSLRNKDVLKIISKLDELVLL